MILPAGCSSWARPWHYGTQTTCSGFEKYRQLGSKASPAESDSQGRSPGSWIVENLLQSVTTAQYKMMQCEVSSIPWKVLWPKMFNLNLHKPLEVTFSYQETRGIEEQTK